MIFGMTLATFALVHALISLADVALGVAVMAQMLRGRALGAVNAAFLFAAALSSITGFFFPFSAIKIPHIFGVVSLLALALAVVALYRQRLAGNWRWIFVLCATLTLYFNLYIVVVQAFRKISFLQALAPTGSEPPFTIAQIVVALLLAGLGVLAVRRFHPC